MLRGGARVWHGEVGYSKVSGNGNGYLPRKRLSGQVKMAQHKVTAPVCLRDTTWRGGIWDSPRKDGGRPREEEPIIVEVHRQSDPWSGSDTAAAELLGNLKGWPLCIPF